jgi:G patch domain-containing protein 1
MDEEDLREAEESRSLSTSDTFAGFGSTEEDPRRQGGMMDIFRPAGETIGVRLLKKMGWKESQGIGPRVRRRANLDEGGESAEVHLFAPENPPMISFVHKKDFKGVGYVGEVGLEKDPSATSNHFPVDSPCSDNEPATRSTSAPWKSKPGKKSGFGVGILNDTGSDDEDPYEMGPKISYNKVIGGDKKSKKKRKDASTSISNPLLKDKPVFVSNKLWAGKGLPGFRKCHDGRLPLDGFALSTELDSLASISLEDDDLKPPVVPPNWKSSKVTSADPTTNPYISTSDAAKSSSLTAQSRAAILGEAQLPSKSVFDFLTPSARNRLAQASGKTDLPSAGSEILPPGRESTDDYKTTTKSLHDLVPRLDPFVAQQALTRGTNGWMPYAEDDAKRARYRAYLEIRSVSNNNTTDKDSKLPPRASGMTTEEWALELQEFARAAQVFKPVTGLMASRFTSSTSQKHMSGAEADASVKTDELLSKPIVKPEDPAEAAARMGMFGPLTRSVQSWYPTRLLCKRFNVKAPDIIGVDPGEMTVSARQESSGASFHSSGASFQSSGYQYAADLEPTSSSKDVSSASAGIGGRDGVKMLEARLLEQTDPASVNPERNEALEQERPGHAVFRAIFGSDDEDEDE